LHVCRLGGAANAICEVGHKATTNFADPRRGSEIVMSLRPCLHTPIDLIVGHLASPRICKKCLILLGLLRGSRVQSALPAE
jgi:hypothetical protein